MCTDDSDSSYFGTLLVISLTGHDKTDLTTVSMSGQVPQVPGARTLVPVSPAFSASLVILYCFFQIPVGLFLINLVFLVMFLFVFVGSTIFGSFFICFYNLFIPFHIATVEVSSHTDGSSSIQKQVRGDKRRGGDGKYGGEKRKRGGRRNRRGKKRAMEEGGGGDEWRRKRGGSTRNKRGL